MQFTNYSRRHSPTSEGCMKNRLTISQVLVFCIVFSQVFGGFENQVSAATQITKKSSLVSLCLNPAGNAARAAQDYRCIEGSENQVSAATQSTKKSSLVSLCLNPAGNAARAAQDDRCSKGSVTSSTTTTVPAKTVKTVKPVETTEPVKTNNKNGAITVSATVPVIANVSNISTGTSGSFGTTGSAGSNVAVVLPVEIPGLISVCVNKSTSVLRDTADNSCSSGSEVKVEWLDSGASPKICVNNNNRKMTLAQDGKCATKNSAVADVTVNKQILACADDKTGVLRYQKSGVCGTNDDPVVWVLKDQGVARNVDSGVKKGVVEIISLIPTTGAGGGASSCTSTSGSTKTVTTSPTTNTSTSTTTTTTAVATAITTTTTSSTTTTTIASRASGSFAGYLGGTCPDGSGVPWYWGSGGQARAGGCSAAASIAPISTGSSGSAATTITVAPVVVPGTPATPTGVSGDAQVTVSVTAGSGGTPTSYTVSASPQVSGVTRTCTVTGASGSCVVTGLTNSTAYTFTTTATNSAGTSGLSVASASVTPVLAVPGTPATPTGVAGNTQVTVSVTAGTGGTPTSYTITKSTDGVNYSTGCTVTVPASSCIVTGLTNGTAYTFKTTATNSAGTSGLSSASASVSPEPVYAVGDTGPGGGVVLYVQASGGTFTSTGSDCGTACKYLEAAPSDQSSGIVWATTAAFCYNSGSTTETNSCQSNSIYSGDSTAQAASRTAATAIGKGMANTNQIHARLTTAGGAVTNTYAAGIAYAYVNNGKTDWHLPSKDELNQMCKWQRGVAWTSDATMCTGGTLNSATWGATGFSSGSYWSSSEWTAAVSAWRQSFDGGVQGSGLRYNPYSVRPVRAFG